MAAIANMVYRVRARLLHQQHRISKQNICILRVLGFVDISYLQLIVRFTRKKRPFAEKEETLYHSQSRFKSNYVTISRFTGKKRAFTDHEKSNPPYC